MPAGAAVVDVDVEVDDDVVVVPAATVERWSLSLWVAAAVAPATSMTAMTTARTGTVQRAAVVGVTPPLWARSATIRARGARTGRAEGPPRLRF